MKKIVTGVDGSETAAAAARKAAVLAQALGAELVVISAYGKLEVERFTSGSEEFIVANDDDARAIAQRTMRDLRPDHPDLTMTAEASGGKPAEALVQSAQRHGAELIVVGNKRIQGVSRVLGSIGREVVQHATCDVYVAYTHTR